VAIDERIQFVTALPVSVYLVLALRHLYEIVPLLRIKLVPLHEALDQVSNLGIVEVPVPMGRISPPPETQPVEHVAIIPHCRLPTEVLE
jgi:hypothetical protein